MKVKSKYIVYSLSFLLILTMVIILLFIHKAHDFLHQHYREDLESNYTKNIYPVYWNYFKEKNHTNIDSGTLLSRHVAYRVYKDKTRPLSSKIFYEWFIRIYLDRDEQINIMLSTDIYKGGIKGINKASTEFFGKNVSVLSNDELHEILNKMY